MIVWKVGEPEMNSGVCSDMLKRPSLIPWLGLIVAALFIGFTAQVGWGAWREPHAADRTPSPATKLNRKDAYIVEMMGQPAGTSVTTETLEGENLITRSEMKFALRRGEVEIKILVQTEFVETGDGKPISMKSRQVLASMPKEETYTFGEKDVTIVTSTMGKPITTTRPLPQGEWLTPAKAGRLTRELAKKGEKQIKFATIDPSNGLSIVEMERSRDTQEMIEIAGKKVEAWKWKSAVIMSNGTRVESSEWVNDESDLLRSTMNFGGIAMTLTRDADAGTHKTFRGPEMMVDLFVKPDKTINNPRQSKMMTYVVRVKEGELPDLPSEAGQTFARIDAKSATVSINAVQSAAAKGVSTPEELAPFLASSSMIDARDEKVAELATAATKDIPAGQMSAKAEALRRAVYQHINKKALDVGFGSASETARSGVGDCSEHGVLLAAMLRQQGIPARVVAGLIYADQFAGERGIFGYHMWTQALLERNGSKRWVDLDATLPAGNATDATHIAVSVTALADGELQSSMMNLVPLLGRLEIQVNAISATPREKPATEPAGAR